MPSEWEENENVMLSPLLNLELRMRTTCESFIVKSNMFINVASSCEKQDHPSIQFDSHTDYMHTSHLCVLIEYVLSDSPALVIESHTDHKNTWHLHGQIEYVLSVYPVLLLDSHTDYKDTLHLHGQIEYVFSDHSDQKMICYTHCIPTLNLLFSCCLHCFYWLTYLKSERPLLKGLFSLLHYFYWFCWYVSAVKHLKNPSSMFLQDLC